MSRSERATCRRTRRALPRLLDGASPPPRQAEHLGHCLPCQAEAVRYRTLGRALVALAGEEEPAPVGLGPAVHRAIEGSPAGRHSRHPGGMAAAATGLAVAFGAVAVVRWHRGRPAA